MAHSGRHIAVITTIVVTLSPISRAAVPSFQGLGDLPGGHFSSNALAVSADGMTVVGEAVSAVDFGPISIEQREAFVWTQNTGMFGLGNLDNGIGTSLAYDVSADGSVVAGTTSSSNGSEPFIWTVDGGMIGLGYFPNNPSSSGAANGISAGGSIVVGNGESTNGREAFIWTQDSGFTGLGDLPGGEFDSLAYDVSSDGSVVVGFSSNAAYSQLSVEAFRWDADTGMTSLGNLGGSSQAWGVSADGATVVGQSGIFGGTVAYKWTSGGGMVALGDLPGGGLRSSALGASADGGVIVGVASTLFEAETAAIWTTDGGPTELKVLLETDYDLDLDGWTLTRASGVSNDGQVIVGEGINPDGNREAWIATLPEPTMLTIVGCGLPMLLRRRSE